MSQLDNAISRLESVTARLEQMASGSSSSGQSSSQPCETKTSNEPSEERLDKYDAWVSEFVNKYAALSDKIGGDVKEHKEMVMKAISTQKLFLTMTTKCSKPSASEYQKLLKDTSDAIASIQEFRESKRRSKQFNHLSAISEMIPILGWVANDKPVQYCQMMEEAAQFYTNKVLKEFRTKDTTQADWAVSILNLAKNLGVYCKTYQTTGLVWNKSGPAATAKDLNARPKTAPKPGKGGAPPPPPPPTLDISNIKITSTPKSSENKAGAMFAEINSLGAGGITKALKHVEVKRDKDGNKIKYADMGEVVKPKAGPVKKAAPKFGTATTKEPVIHLVGSSKWNIEYQESNNDIDIETTMKQVVYIYKCNKSTIKINGKCNSITVDGCKKVNIVFDNVVAGVNIINCQSVKAQVMGTLPMIQVDKTDGFHVYLNKQSLKCQIITAKSSEMNVSVPTTEEDDFDEHPLPEQFVTTWNGKTFETNPSEC